MPHPLHHRRNFLRRSAALAAALACPLVQAIEARQITDGRLIIIFLRGALDGLFVFSPIADSRLSTLRPGLANSVLSNGIRLGYTGFAAHPEARILAELFATRQLAFAPCAGTTDKSRSHFQAQDLFELGSGATQGSNGFLARAADALGGQRSTICFTSQIPLAFQGARRPPDVAPLSGRSIEVAPNRALDAIMAMHQQQTSGAALEQAMNTQAALAAAQEMDAKAARGAAGINGFPKAAENMARLLRANPRQAISFFDIGGFDTHAGQATTLSRALPLLGSGLLALRDGLGEAEWQRTQVLVCTEFGRTVRENGTQGTDHGHGGLALLLGGNIDGGKMIGSFRGLQDSALYEGRDLPVTVDWRSLIGRAMRDTLGFDAPTLNTVLPGMPGLA